MKQKIAIVGSGISGLACAWLLAREGHAVTLLEADSRAGGHTNTVTATLDHERFAVDTGFIVFNHATYPNLTALFDFIDIETHPSTMTFSVSTAQGIEYAGQSLNSLFAQRRNLLRPSFWQMLFDVKRFYAEATRLELSGNLTLAELLAAQGYSDSFANNHLLPMAAAIWSTDANEISQMQAQSFVDFFQHHGLLQLRDRPQWYTVPGGATRYVQKLLQQPGIMLQLDTRITHLQRTAQHVDVTTETGTQRFDQVVLATHADTALTLLDQPTRAEQGALGEFKYSTSTAWLHTDPSLMPRNRRAWASWNYTQGRRGKLSVTYWMNRLQPLTTDRNVFVTLNPDHDPESALATFDYDHPVLNTATAAARHQLWDLQGHLNTWFCGAYFGHGFHEDGLQSGLAVAEAISGGQRPWQLAEPNHRITVTPGPSHPAVAA
ncbi:MAG: FAD-dependent oxidoreductase [Proteobacteria bacterium]|jgi:predicted NAD/FAD-binding protein|nr:FAD-dependent oxidoreductase [Pseudomonadota bacterium]